MFYIPIRLGFGASALQLSGFSCNASSVSLLGSLPLPGQVDFELLSMLLLLWDFLRLGWLTLSQPQPEGPG
jgi:hypothetical protein